MNRVEYFMDMAAQIAASIDRTEQQWRLAAVVAHGRNILGIGQNTYNVVPALAGDFSHCSVHAEIAALNQTKLAHHVPRKAAIYVARVNSTGFGLARPCNECYQEMVACGIKRAYFTDDQGNIHCERISDVGPLVLRGTSAQRYERPTEVVPITKMGS